MSAHKKRNKKQDKCELVNTGMSAVNANGNLLVRIGESQVHEITQAGMIHFRDKLEERTPKPIYRKRHYAYIKMLEDLIIMHNDVMIQGKWNRHKYEDQFG